MSDADELKARLLLRHLRDSGQNASVDEVRGMIASQTLSGMTSGLEACWVTLKYLKLLLHSPVAQDQRVIHGYIISRCSGARSNHG